MATASKFDSATFLRGLGWNGPGSSLNNSAAGRAKPVTVAQKKTLSGVGRDRDTSFAWWDAVFTSVAQKVGGDKTEQQRTTSTGILSHRPPPPTGSAYEPLSDSQKSGLNLDAMAAVKLELARRQLYSGFLRGSVLQPDPALEKGTKENAPAAKEDGDARSLKKRKRDEGEDRAAADGGDRAAAKEARKAEKRARKDEDKAAKKAAKTAARKGKARADEGGEGAVVAREVVESLEVSTTTTPAEPAAAPALALQLSKEERRAAKKLRKQLVGAVSASASPAPSSLTALSSAAPTASASPAPADPALDAEEQAYLEAKAAARRAEKEERRLAKAAKKALKASAEA
ncbi:hypothetical protein JCM10449v2_007714 [Rhodotorula kratochvilovae]